MKCPVCKGWEHVEVDLHADGFSQEIEECGDCGSIWTYSRNVLKILKGRTDMEQKAFAHFLCPACKSTTSIETDLDAFQFHEEIYECTTCGTVCSSVHNQIEVVKDTHQGSFLSPSSDQVEADESVAGRLPVNSAARKTLENACVEAAALEAAEIVLADGPCSGEEFCRKLWAMQQRLLKEKYELDWEAPFQVR